MLPAFHLSERQKHVTVITLQVVTADVDQGRHVERPSKRHMRHRKALGR
jgi:hypothetical protein